MAVSRSWAFTELAVAWWAALVLVSAVSWAFMLLSQLSVASCTATSCNYSLFSLTVRTFEVGSVGIVVAALVAIFLLREHPRAALWPPLIGMVGVIVLVCVTYALGRGALDLPLFGGRAA